MTSDERAPAQAQSDAPPDDFSRIQDFVFTRELAEIYLLLDNISMSSSKSFQAGAPAAVAIDQLGDDWIEKVCEIGWPPTGTNVEQAIQASTLIKTRDVLNTMATPATGATIAFTLLVVGEANQERQREVGEHRSNWWRRLGERLWGAGRQRTKPDAGSSLNVAGFAEGAPSRTSLAGYAFPGLVRQATHFRFRLTLIIFGLFLWLLVTCALSWNIAVGNAALGQLTTIKAQRDAVAKQIDDAAAGTGASERGSAGVTAPPPPAAGEEAIKPVVPYCDRAQRLPMLPDESGKLTIRQFDNATELRLCTQLTEADGLYGAAQGSVVEWLATWQWLQRLPWPSRESSVAVKSSEDGDIQWASILAGVLAGTVLPIAYGILGAGAAVLRGLSRKMRDSTLSPRDLLLSLVQLALGAVIGACVGLFVAPSGSPSSSTQGLIGTVPLTASALCFIAGFGVESVFVALESLLTRVFNVNDPNRKPT